MTIGTGAFVVEVGSLDGAFDRFYATLWETALNSLARPFVLRTRAEKSACRFAAHLPGWHERALARLSELAPNEQAGER